MASRNPRLRTDARPNRLDWPRWKHVAISAFILFHLVAITCWSVPINSLLIPKCKQLIGHYMLWSGLFQGWDMFAPDPSKLNCYVVAEIKYRDGQTRLWKFPRMQELGYVERYFRERFRKFSTEYLRTDDHAAMWPEAARYVARVNSSASNPPVSVSLIRYWSEIGPQEPGKVYKPGLWYQYTFFTYPVKPADLQ